MLTNRVLAQICENIEKYNMFESNDTVVVGVSGGADSIMLLYCLNALKDKYKITLKVAHVNHKIRVGAAESDAKFVSDVCKELGIPFYLKEANVKQLAKEWKMSEEEAGRKVRYSFFREIADGGKIATAHNANDNVETVIMRFMRGTGIKGLSGISFKNEDIVRPILNISRKDIEEYIKENNLTHITDSTNFEPIYTRNKIRLNVIPYILKVFNPNFVDTVTSNIASYREDADYFEKEVENAYNSIVVKEENNISVSINLLLSYHPAIYKRLIRRIIETIMGTEQIDVSSKRVQDIVSLTENKVSTVLPLNRNYVVRVGYNSLVFEKVIENKKNMNEYSVPLKTDIEFAHATVVDLDFNYSVFDVESLEIDNKVGEFYLPYSDYIDKTLTIRTRRDGDVVRVEDGIHKKLNKFLADKKIDNSIRDNLLLLCDGNEVLCVFGYFVTRFSKRNGRFIKFRVDNL